MSECLGFKPGKRICTPKTGPVGWKLAETPNTNIQVVGWKYGWKIGYIQQQRGSRILASPRFYLW
jgi:hypothetical protein